MRIRFKKKKNKKLTIGRGEKFKYLNSVTGFFKSNELKRILYKKKSGFINRIFFNLFNKTFKLLPAASSEFSSFRLHLGLPFAYE